MPGLGKQHHINLEGQRTGSVLQKAMAAQAEIHFGRRPGERWRERGRFNQPLFTTNRARPSAPRTSHHFPPHCYSRLRDPKPSFQLETWETHSFGPVTCFVTRMPQEEEGETTRLERKFSSMFPLSTPLSAPQKSNYS